MAHLNSRSATALFTDLYELTMAQGFWKSQMKEHEAVFHLFYRKAPFGGNFALCCGLQLAIDYLRAWRFTADDVAYLKTLLSPQQKPLFENGFCDYLQQMVFSCDLDAIAEGTVVFPQEPLLRIRGPLIQCQLLEGVLLNLLNFSTLIATKAARICYAAQDDPVIEFGLRRAQGVDGALTASRAAYLGGCAATSSVLAGKLFGIPVSGTLAHSWVMAFDSELEAFFAYARAMPDNCLFLVDTYSSLEGVKRALEVARWLREQGKSFLGIRLDSGDLDQLSKEARRLLDEAGFPSAMIVASNQLDEAAIAELKRRRAPIAAWGVGTRMVTGDGDAALDGVYKLAAIRAPGQEWKDKMKLTEDLSKVSLPGSLNLRRYYKGDTPLADCICGSEESGVNLEGQESALPKSDRVCQLLTPIFTRGLLNYNMPPLAQVREIGKRQWASFTTLVSEHGDYPVVLSPSLKQKMILLRKTRG